MKSFPRLIQILEVVLGYGVLPEFKLTRRRRLPREVRLRLAFEQLGATWIKLGQGLALRFDLLPPSYATNGSNCSTTSRRFPTLTLRR